MAMAEPPIQIVDEHNQVIGAMHKDEAKSRGLYHQLIRVIAEDSIGRVLLQKRASDEAYYPNLWDTSSAGHVDAGETYEIAAVLETMEEIGVADVKLELIADYLYEHHDYKGRDIRQFTRLYKIGLDTTPNNLNKDEVGEVQWFDKQALLVYMQNSPQDFTPGAKDAIERYCVGLV